jgi:hypothetical protein
MSSITKLVAGTCAVALVGTIGTAPAYAKDTKQTDWRKKREFVYFLPKTRAVVNVGQRITRCARTEGEEPSIENEIVITDSTGADPGAMVRLDGRSGFLAKRTTKLTLAADGTLQAFNASTEGQGGEVAAALIKTAVTAGTFAFAPSLSLPKGLDSVKFMSGGKSRGTAQQNLPTLECNDTTKELLEKLASLSTQIASLEALVASGAAETPQIELLAESRKRQKLYKDDLTLTSDPAAFNPNGRPTGSNSQNKLIGAVNYAQWFKDVRSPAAQAALAKIPGSSGFVAKLTPNKELFERLTGDLDALPASATPYLFYRRPVPASVEVAPCASGATPVTPTVECSLNQSAAGKLASASKKLSFAQLSGFYAIPIGKGRMFGTRQASAKFDASGAPTELEYGSGSAGGDVAKMLTAVNDGAVTLRDAEMAAWKRAADEATSRKTYQDAKKHLEELENGE